MLHRRLLFVVALLCVPAQSESQTPRINPAGIEGSLLLCGRYQPSPEAFARFVELAGGAKAKIVIVTFDNAKFGGPPVDKLTTATQAAKAAEPIVVDYADVKKKLPEATGIWLHVDSVSPMKQIMRDGILAERCRAILKRGGVIASCAAGTRYVGSIELAINTVPCMNLLPDSLIHCWSDKKRPSMVKKTPARLKDVIGYEIEHDAAMLVKGRTISVVGPGKVHIYMTDGARNFRRQMVMEGKSKEDLTSLRRNLRDVREGYPPLKVEPPVVENGTLVIVGGGGSPAGLYKKFVEYAGGKGKAVVVIFPTAAADPLPKRESIAAAFRKAGAKKATVLYAQKQADVESKVFLDALKEATGLWFDGGRQWRFVDCYEDTKALPLMHDVLKRGGVIGGTSAGATIQGDYLARGGVFNNFDIRYPGYERGLGFLKGVAIDQHFSKRKRHGDMTDLMKLYPQYLGIGLDEATAIVVKGSIAEVIGRDKVFFYDANRKVDKGQPDYQALSAGGRYDMKARKVLAAEK